MNPSRESRIGFGIEAGYYLTLLDGSWRYQWDNNGYHSRKVSSIPNVSLNGIYLMGKIGWFFTNK